MTTMKQQCVYACGPYKDYCGRAEYDDESGTFHGEIVGTRDVVTFSGASLQELGPAFQASVDDYLAFCEQLGEAPEKPFSGKFVTRLEPELHRKVSLMAHAAGKSLNQFVCDCLEAMTASAPMPAAPRSRAGGRRKTGQAGGRLRPAAKRSTGAKRRSGRRKEPA